MTAYLKASGLVAGMNTHRIFAAWDEASGAACHTLKRFFRNGRLTVTVNSSVVCSQLQFQKQALIDRMNLILEKDAMFIKDDATVGFVKELVIK